MTSTINETLISTRWRSRRLGLWERRKLLYGA